MQIVLHADKNREYEYAVDSGCSKEITIKKRTTLRVPNGSSALVFRQAGFCKKQNIFFLALISFVLAFLKVKIMKIKDILLPFIILRTTVLLLILMLN